MGDGTGILEYALPDKEKIDQEQASLVKISDSFKKIIVVSGNAKIWRNEQGILELKSWRGERYNAAGEKQISEYLDYWKLDTGYMLSFNFNKKKEPGVNLVHVGDKLLYEGTV